MLVEPLLRAIECGLANPSGASQEEASLFCYALYLLAKWREPRAYPYVLRWLSLPGEEPFEIAGDVVTQDGGRILAAVCDGDLEPIKALVLDRSANEYGRSSGVTALALLAAWAEVPRESIVSTFLWLARERLEREPSQVWNSLAADSADIEALVLFPELRRAYADGLIERQFMHPSELDEVEAAPRGRGLEDTRDRHPLTMSSTQPLGGHAPTMRRNPPSRRRPIERRQKPDATNRAPAAVPRSSKSVAAVDAPQREVSKGTRSGHLRRHGV